MTSSAFWGDGYEGDASGTMSRAEINNTWRPRKQFTLRSVSPSCRLPFFLLSRIFDLCSANSSNEMKISPAQLEIYVFDFSYCKQRFENYISSLPAQTRKPSLGRTQSTFAWLKKRKKESQINFHMSLSSNWKATFLIPLAQGIDNGWQKRKHLEPTQTTTEVKANQSRRSLSMITSKYMLENWN